MEKSLFAELKRIGIDEELASQISASLDPDYNASKKDVLIMQEAMLQLQARSDDRNNEFIRQMKELQTRTDEKNNELIRQMAGLQTRTDERHFQLQARTDERYHELKNEMINGFAELRTEMGSMHRQYWITFGGLITTIFSVFAVNWYFH